ncbi:MAG: hypothetical protein NXI04_21105 [Planctomycetaceae bacterium]|nr:hypothetical protein [Planctomycetaceae bacterium]
MNERPNITRCDFAQLNAILSNRVRHGRASQNHDQHADFRVQLRGRISWFEQLNPLRGQKRRRLFVQIEW